MYMKIFSKLGKFFVGDATDILNSKNVDIWNNRYNSESGTFLFNKNGRNVNNTENDGILLVSFCDMVNGNGRYSGNIFNLNENKSELVEFNINSEKIAIIPAELVDNELIENPVIIEADEAELTNKDGGYSNDGKITINFYKKDLENCKINSNFKIEIYPDSIEEFDDFNDNNDDFEEDYDYLD